MKKTALLILSALLVLTFASCSSDEQNDLTSSLDGYIAPTYTHTVDIENNDADGTITFAEGAGDTAVIADYVGPYTSHNLVIPEVIEDRTVTSIGDEAFYFCTSLISVTIPDEVESIGDWAFAGCTALKTIVIPSSVTSIGEGAFYGCNSLESIVFEGVALESIGNFAFKDCNTLASISCTASENTNLPSMLNTIGAMAFEGCSELTSVVTPAALTTIGDLAFYNCTGLNAPGALDLSLSVNIPESNADTADEDEEIVGLGKFIFNGIDKENIKTTAGTVVASYVEAMEADEEAATESSATDAE